MPTFSLCWCGSLAIVGFVGMVDIFGSIFIPIGALDERAPAGPFCFKPRWLLGLSQFRALVTSAGDRAFDRGSGRHFV